MNTSRDKVIFWRLVALVVLTLLPLGLAASLWPPARQVNAAVGVPGAVRPYVMPQAPGTFPPGPIYPEPPTTPVEPGTGPKDQEPNGDHWLQLQARSEARWSLYLEECDYADDRLRMFGLFWEFYFPANNHTVRVYEDRSTDSCGYRWLYWFPWWLTVNQVAYVSVKAEGHLVAYTSIYYAPNSLYRLPFAYGGDSETQTGTWNLVDNLDFNSLRAAYGYCTTTPNTQYTRRNDFDWDRCVGVMDFQQIQLNYGKPGHPTVCEIHPCSPLD